MTAFAKSAVDENGFAPPRQGSLALDIGKATLAGIDARTVKAQVKFDSGALQIEHLSVGELGGAALDISGRIDELSSQPRGRVTVDLNAGTLADLSRVLGQFAPQTADVLRRAADRLAPAKLHGTLTVERAATAGSTAKLDLNGQLGLMRVALNGAVAGEPAKLGEANVRIDSRLDADDGTALATLFGLNRVVAVDQLPGRVTLSAAGPLNGELRVDGEASASGFTAAVRGAVRLNGKEAPAWHVPNIGDRRRPSAAAASDDRPAGQRGADLRTRRSFYCRQRTVVHANRHRCRQGVGARASCRQSGKSDRNRR